MASGIRRRTSASARARSGSSPGKKVSTRHAALPGRSPLRRAGTMPARTSDDLPQPDGPTTATVTLNVDMNLHIDSGEFNPDVDFLDVAGTFNGWNGSDHLTDADGDGIYAINLYRMQVGQKIEFKYRINGSWDTSEFPDGGPNRTHIIRYWNVLDHVYNNGFTSTIITQDLISSINIYPNPNKGIFTIDLKLKIPSKIIISLTDVRGKVHYKNTLSNVGQEKLLIDQKLSPGLYFLNIDDGRKLEVRKMIVL